MSSDHGPNFGRSPKVLKLESRILIQRFDSEFLSGAPRAHVPSTDFWSHIRSVKSKKWFSKMISIFLMDMKMTSLIIFDFESESRHDRHV